MENKGSRTSEPDCPAIEINDFVGHTSAAESRPYDETLRKQENQYQECIRSYIRSGRTYHKDMYPNAYPSSPHTRHILATNDFRRSMPFEEPTVVPVRRQVKSCCLPMQKSIRDTVSDLPMTSLGYKLYQNKLRDYLYATKLHDYLYLTKLSDYLYLNKLRDYLYLARIDDYLEEQSKFNEERLKFSRLTAMKRDQSLKNTNSHSIYSKVKTHLRTLDEMTHHLTPKEPTRVSMYQVKGYTRRKQGSRKTIDSEVELKASNEARKKQIEYNEGQSELKQRETRNEDHHPSTPNTKTCIPPKNSLQHNLTFKTPTIDFVERQIKSDALPMGDPRRDWSQQLSDLKIYLARLREEYPEEQLKFDEEKLQFSQSTVTKKVEGTENYNYHRFYSAARTPFGHSDAIPHNLSPQDLIGVNRSQVRKDTRSDRDSSKNAVREIIPRTSKNLLGNQIKFKEDHISLRRQEKIRGEKITYPNDHCSPKARQLPSNSDSRTHYVTFKESTEFIDESPMKIRSPCMQDSSRVNRLTIHEEYPEEQLVLGEVQYQDFRYGETRKSESILNSNVRKRLHTRVSKFQEAPTVIDQYQLSFIKHVQDSSRDAESGASSEESVMESNRPWCKTNLSRLSRRIEHIWLHLCTNGKNVGIGFVILGLLLLILTKLY